MMHNLNKPGSLDAWLNYLEGLDPNKITLGLKRVSNVYHALKLDFSKCAVIEVAGTNGKGSTAALIAGACSKSGIITGLYTSPHIYKFNERVNVDGVDIDDEQMCEAFSCVFDAAQITNTPLSYFEYTTLAAFVYFAKRKVQVLVLEIGLGGRLDAVNVLDANIAVITSIGLDHTQLLGDSLDKIAFEKAGIIKDKAKVVVGNLANEALDVIKDVAGCKKSSLFIQGYDFDDILNEQGYSFKSSLLSLDGLAKPLVPLSCAPIALMVLSLLREMGLKIKIESIKEAVASICLMGRMQRLRTSPEIYLDVAHNPPAASHLVKQINAMPALGKRIAVIGMLKDKDIEAVANILAQEFDGFYLCSLHTQRGEHFARLEQAFVRALVDKAKIQCFETSEKAILKALKDADDKTQIFVLGSFVTVTEVSQTLKEIK